MAQINDFVWAFASVVLVSCGISSVDCGSISSFLTRLSSSSSIILVISAIPLVHIKYEKNHEKIKLLECLKKYDKRNLLAFTMYELSNILDFLFPIYIAIYITNTYTMAGSINAISNISIIIFIIIYGKTIKTKNRFVVSMIAFVIVNILKLITMSYIILIVYFIEGIIKKMQNQSLNKVYFENRGKIGIKNYNLIYQIIESFFRMIVAIPLLFFNNILSMLIFVILIIVIELILYILTKRNKVLS